MKKRESKLWQRIKKHCTKPHLIRVESNTVNGIPDINGCWDSKEFWIELKSTKLDIRSYLNGKLVGLTNVYHMVV